MRYLKVFLLIAFLWCSDAHGAYRVFSGTTHKDAHIDSVVYNKNKGGHTSLSVGTYNCASNDFARGLLQFIISADSIGTADIIDSAFVELYKTDFLYGGCVGGPDSNPETTFVYFVKRDWEEGTNTIWTIDEVSWIKATSAVDWTGDGCEDTTSDRSGSAMDTTLIDQNSTDEWIRWYIYAQLVDDWIDGDITNNGIIIIQKYEDVKYGIFDFNSSENASNKPKLTVYYTVGVAADFGIQKIYEDAVARKLYENTVTKRLFLGKP